MSQRFPEILPQPLNVKVVIDADTARQSARKAAAEDEEIAPEDGSGVVDVPPLAKKVEAFTEEETVRKFVKAHAPTASAKERVSVLWPVGGSAWPPTSDSIEVGVTHLS